MRVYKTGDSTQQGMVAIVITMLVITIIAMMVLTFARVIRRDTRQTIDRQLSAQALYAAETGINDVVELAKTVALQPKTSCDNTGIYAGLNPNLDGANNVAYTCVLVDPEPERLKVNKVKPFESRTINVESSTNYSQITIEWEAENPPDTLDTSCDRNGGAAAFKAIGAWGDCNPLVRLDLVPVSGANLNGDDPNNLNAVYSAFVFPGTGANPPTTYASGTDWGGQGVTVDGNCEQDRLDASLQCRVVIPVTSGTDYRLRIMPIYKAAEFAISAQVSAGGDNVNLENSQYVIDVTGKAQDVLRRVRIYRDVRVQSPTAHSFGLQTEDTLCKLLSVVPGDTTTADAACPLP